MSSAQPALVPAPLLEKVLHFDCPTDVYRADACVISCFDARFDAAMRKFLKRSGILLYDHVKIPASVKPWASDNDADADVLLRALRTSLRLHQPPRVLLFGHSDCGGYPGTPDAVVAGDVRCAGDFLRRAEPSLCVECYFAAFDGIYSVK